MSEIRIRQTGQGTLKTLDRASIMNDHIIEHGLRTKEVSANRNDQQPQQSDEYARNRVDNYARRGIYGSQRTVYLGAKAGAKQYEQHRSGRQVRNRQGEMSNAADESAQEAGASTKRARAFSQRTGAPSRNSHGSMEQRGRQPGAPAFAKGRGKTIRTREAVHKKGAQRYRQKRQRELYQKQIRKETIRKLQIQTRKASQRARKGAKAAVKNAIRAMRIAVESSKALIGLLVAGGSISVIIIVICVLFGAAFAIISGGGEDGDMPDIPELAEFDDYNIGVPDTDIVRAAAAEIGNRGGRKYWSWYGFKSRVSWCACFVSYIGAKCGYIQSGAMPKFSIVSTGADWFRSHHQWRGRYYKSAPGCLIFFDWGGNGTRDHVGIVERCDGKRVYTIEGNTSDQVARRSYPVGSFEICGYGILKQ